MVTADEIGRIAVFETLEAADRERLARVAADISLAPGSYAVHVGEERALFGVLEGGIEAIRIVEGIEQVVGTRSVGDVFGEVPLTLGTVFPVGFRAAGSTRVLAHRAVRLLRRCGGRTGSRDQDRQAREQSNRWTGRVARPRGRASAAARDRARLPVGFRLHRDPALPRSQPDRLQMAPAGRARRRRAVVGRAARRRRLPDSSCRQWQDGGAATASPGGGAARRADRA